MATRNDITGDLIKTKTTKSSAYSDNFDLIFRNKVKEAAPALCDICGKVLNDVKECAWTGCSLNWDETRIDIIGPNGNEGLHYEDNDKG